MNRIIKLNLFTYFSLCTIVLIFILKFILYFNTTTYQNSIVIGVVNFHSEWGDKAANIEQMKTYIEEASTHGVNILVFPELALTGYSDEEKRDGAYLNGLRKNEKMHVQLAETVPSLDPLASSNQIAGLCEKYNMYVVYGLPERDPSNDTVYNAAAIISPSGVEGTYRKINPIEPETSWCVAGSDPFVLDTKWGPIGISICYDTYAYPELSRYYGAKGCKLILNPTASSKAYGGASNDMTKWFWYYTNRLEGVVNTNGLYIASANLIGEETAPIDRTIADNTFPGGSVIVGPSGSSKDLPSTYYGVRASSPYIPAKPLNDEEGLYLATLDLSLATLEGFSTEMYKPALYQTWYTFLASADKEEPSTAEVRVGVMDFTPVWGNKTANLNQIKEAIIKAGEDGLKLLLFPELALSGYSLDENGTSTMQETLAESIPGPSTQEIAALCKKYNLYVILGMPEKADDDKFYNALAIIGPQGIIGSYRKIHPDSSSSWYETGETPFIIETEFGKIGLCIDDELSTELIRYYAGMGCQIVLNATHDSPTLHTDQSSPYFKMAYKNQLEYVADTNSIFILVANLSGTEYGKAGDILATYPGTSTIIGPKYGAVTHAKHEAKNDYYVDYYGEPLAEMPSLLSETIKLTKARLGSLYATLPSKIALYATWYQKLKFDT